MKNLLLYLFFFLIASLFVGCIKTSNIPVEGRYKARFEKEALCYNYTFTVIEGDIVPSLVEATWTNPQTNVTYTKAFGLGNPCDFPKNLKEGDEFYFGLIRPEDAKQCAVCDAYYPNPAKKLFIKIIP